MPLATRSPAPVRDRSWSGALAAVSLGLALLLSACASNEPRGDRQAPAAPMKPIDPAPRTAPVAPPVAPVTPAPPEASQVPAPPPSPAPVAKADDPAAAPIVVHAGLHRCELARRVLVKRVSSEGDVVQINWNGKDYSLRGVSTRSGARRYEDSKAGLAWVVISVKAFLLDTRRGQMLANECKL